MSHELYKRYRPKTLERVVGNKNTVSSLTKMVEGKTIPHTLLFYGPAGCGKTTLARIIMRSLDCHEMDQRELNCSDFRGVDTIRDIMRTMNLAPTGAARVWILDEVHQLSKDAQNAALKMLEDTPDHVYFILSTTDPQKLLKTIRSRCTEMPVAPLSSEEMEGLLARVCKKEGIEVKDEVKEEIVTCAMGSARTALVLLGKIITLDESEQLEAVAAKLAEQNEAIELARALIKKESWKKVISILKNLKGEPEQIRYTVLGYARAIMLNGNTDHHIYNIMQHFAENFYDTKEAGLAMACWRVLFLK
jgi:DNA polymerase-3 subunit gamma/tau